MKVASNASQFMRVIVNVLLFAIVPVTCVSSQVCLQPQTGLVSWWDGDTISGLTAHDIWNENDGTLMNGVAIETGIVGDAFSLDGVDDYIEVSNETSFDIAFEITLQAWVYGHDTAGVVISKDTGGNGYALVLGSDGYMYINIFTTGGYRFARSPVALNSWQHFAGVYDGTSVKIYRDGVLEDSVSASGSITSNNHPLKIGVRASDNAYPFSGLIDEVTVHQRALTADEIETIAACKRIPFAVTTVVKAKVDFDSEAVASDGFVVKGKFALGEASNWIDLLNEDVEVNVGESIVTIPAGSFVGGTPGSFRFEGFLDDTYVKMVVREVGAGAFAFRLRADGVDLSGTANPVHIGIIIGDDRGEATLRLGGKLKFGYAEKDDD